MASECDPQAQMGNCTAGASAEQPAAEVLDVRPIPAGAIHGGSMRITRAVAATALTTGALALSAVLAPAASADDHDDHDDRSGGVTTVVLNPELVPVLVETLGVATVAPAELSAPGGVAQVSF